MFTANVAPQSSAPMSTVDNSRRFAPEGSSVDVGLFLNCRDLAAIAPFWAAALHYVVLGAAENLLLLVPDGRPGPNVLLQQVPEAKTVGNQIHIYFDTSDIVGEVGRLEQLGARFLQGEIRSERGGNWVMMADPEGNEFCLCDEAGCVVAAAWQGLSVHLVRFALDR